jgi:hypothetical protein
MNLRPLNVIVIFWVLSFIFLGCKEEEPQGLGQNYRDPCGVIKRIAQSSSNCQCSIVFKDYVNTYTFTKIESSYNALGPYCKQNLFKIKYINSTHEHNQTDFEFGFYLPQYTDEEFFRVDTFRIDTLGYSEYRQTGGHGGPRYSSDVLFIWDEVKLKEGIYTGKGKFIINKKIPVNYPATYFFPAQEISFEFCEPRE